MKLERNHLNQCIGYKVSDWQSPPLPKKKILQGQYCRLEPLNPNAHAEGLWSANKLDKEGKAWTYLPYGPFESFSNYKSWLEDEAVGDDPLFFAIFDLKTGQVVGVASFLRIQPAMGSIEVGHLNFSPLLQRTRASTEAMFLMMSYAFEMGYRRYEWKCNALNTPSRTAAQRLGFSFEGIFRQASVVKDYNRDTAWYAIMDHEWPAIQDAMNRWLSSENFDEQGNQKLSLSSLTSPLLHQGIEEKNKYMFNN